MRRIALMLISLALAFGLAEAAVRASGRVYYRPLPPKLKRNTWNLLTHQPSPVAGLAFEMVPDSTRRWRHQTIQTNSLGNRDQEPMETGDDQLVRVAAVGDSFAFGWGVSPDKSFPQQLETLLNRDAVEGVRFDVLNYGVCGYASRDEALVFEHKALQWEPEVLVIGYVLNDPQIVPNAPLPIAFNEPEWWQHSHLLRLVAQVWVERQVRKVGDGDYFRYLHSDETYWGSVVDSFADISRLAEDNGTKVILVIFPHLPSPGASWEDYPYADLHEKVAELGKGSGFEIINLYPTFRGFPPRRFGVTKADRHPNAFGHGLAAHALRKRMGLWYPDSLSDPAPSG